MKTLKKTVKRLDMFGHPILLHVDTKGEYHKTLYGGILSLFYIVFALSYLGYCLAKMI
jgi:hypothetical protein